MERRNRKFTANEAKDTESRDQIQMHLAHIAKMFAAGDFNAPMLVHDKVPPGTATMQRLKSEIIYAYEKTEMGSRILFATKNSEALAAVHGDSCAFRSTIITPVILWL